MKKLAVGILAVFLGTASPATAASFGLSSYDVDLNYPGSGLLLWTKDLLQVPFGDNEPFSLNLGQSLTVALFEIGTNEQTIEWDDWIPYVASVSFEFWRPNEASGHVWGITGGGYFGYRIGEQGYIAWNNPLEISFDTGEVLEISLSHEKFGVPGKAVVYATFELTAGGTGPSPTPVPEPSSLALVGFGVATAVSRWRRRVSAASV
jgi:PEP-CTERM motif-containing protein